MNVKKLYLDRRIKLVNSLIKRVKKDFSMLVLKGLVTIDHS